MSKEEMSARTSETGEVEVPAAFANNTAGYPPWVFELRRTLYCKAKQNPKYQFYTLYGLVCREEVIMAAWRTVSRNDGAPGMDGVSIEQIRNSAGGEEQFLKEIREELLAKQYQPNVVKRVFIPKANGKLRPLGIPTVKDRVVQAAVLLVIEPIFEADFLECSHGFRPRRSAHDALNQLRGAIRDGYEMAYDADLASYFDTIPHDKLMKCVQRRITDGSILKLIRMWLRAVVAEKNGDDPPRYYRPKQGTPQGGVISPLLANLYLHFFDVMFHQSSGPGVWAKAKLIRYADDFVILTKHGGTRLAQFVEHAIEQRMGLRINREKTKVRDLRKKGTNLTFLGYEFRREKATHWNGWYNNMLPSKRSLTRIRERIHEITDMRRGCIPIRATVRQINRTLAGWAQYFSLGFCQPAYGTIDSYVFNRLEQHLKRRSQRPYRPPHGVSWHSHIETLGYQRLNGRLRTA